ncbi:hypothetical protein C900_03851 [Fulvivirga imtechensis AK7]|uniref:DUF155 domain-containing protein n=1 Tax=Fulvivirga imtechensis AK7 TaxID=1237149 RepID=L8JML8_9BACT|nr:RMD1 family protein [Fulvivirga imtechensis]ELR70166.1 hypothetical protein C900_03851 [Fulvivirga imtechensis AK7]
MIDTIKTTMDRKELVIQAWHLKDNIDIRQCREKNCYKIISESKSDIFFEPFPGKYVFIFNYGVIVFYHLSVQEIDSVLKQLFPGTRKASLFHDTFGLIRSDSDEINIQFNSLSLKLINEETIKIIMLNLAQSVALIYYDEVSQDLLAHVRQFTSQMEEQGKLKISRKNILRFIGKALNTKNKIAENLYIFDAPPVTWNNEYLDKVHTTLSRHFDLGPRYRSIENTFNIVEANLDTYMELYHQKESSKLEWIIIILIFVEVIDTFLTKVL